MVTEEDVVGRKRVVVAVGVLREPGVYRDVNDPNYIPDMKARAFFQLITLYIFLMASSIYWYSL